MTERQILVVKNSWSYVVLISDEAGILFYNRLFEIAPEVKPLFRGEMKDQVRKLMTMLTAVVTKLDKLGEIIDEVKALAKRHVGYGVEEKHFAWVGSALIWTLEQGLGDKWNEEVKEAWLIAYTILSEAMIATMKTQEAI